MSGDKIRLFVALELPARVRAALVKWARGIAPPDAGLRLVADSSLHVTLCFLGWRPASEVGEIAGACSILEQSGPASLSLGEGLWLPRRRPRVLAVELEDAGGILTRAQASLARVLIDRRWYEPEQRSFLPHVTVGRVGRGARIRAAALPPVPSFGFEGSRVTLYQSRLAPGGARYEPLATVELTAE